MKKAYNEVFCIRGRGAFKAGVCYPMMAGNVLVNNSFIIYGFAANQTRTAEKGGYFEVLHGCLEQSGARFVKVTRCRRRKQD